MYHDFWLREVGIHSYKDYYGLVSQKDAPVHISDDLLRYVVDTFSWIPTCNPAKEMLSGRGLNLYGPTVINQAGGYLFHRVCTSWANIFSTAPEHLHLRGLFRWQWPFAEEEHLVREDQLHILGHFERLEVDREWLVQTFTTLAEFGNKAATGQFFILHLGI